MAHILIVEDDELTSEVIARELRPRGHEVVQARDGVTGLRLAQEQRFDALTLDRMLPGLDGLSLVSQLRAEGVTTPVLMISALSDVDERIAGLRAGGDDYLVKPFAPSEMAARIEVLLRRVQQAESTVLQVGSLRMDLIRREVSVDGEPVRLLQMEFRLLELLARGAGEVIGRQIIFERVWGYYFDPGANLINVHIARLRKKLDRPGRPSAIVTVKGEGYRLDAV
ncbi:response regulator transcription factor [Sphingomonas sp. AP4-R1]|uniref:response regulator transcription factor n=1 Tax=Sphingomonas sp. AP4-R1 TaxID=2735134 RepID=UPI001493BBF6|nr:response regulator transcription factor [Sphingomonas sp. AP4-R1]QJU57720.1 response regulator transcription factor [Sphingomonas sp. AP4-R1]